MAPLPLGSNRPLGWSLLALATGLLLAAWAMHHLWKGDGLQIGVERVRGPLVLFATACTWALIQFIPWIPFGLAHPAWQEVSIFFGEDVPGRITVNPDWSVTSLMRWLTYASVFWLALQLGRNRENASLGLKLVVLGGAVYALYGLLTHLTGSGSILIYDKWAYQNVMTSTFVNRNSYATYAGIGLIISVLLLMRSFRNAPSGRLMLRERVSASLSGSLLEQLALSISVFLLISALFLTASRAGVLSSMAGLLVLAILPNSGSKKSPRHRIIPITSVFVALIGAYVLSSDYLLERLSGLSLETRLATYVQTVDAIRDHFLWGSGLGSFAQIFPLYRESEISQTTFWTKAHNTYLEVALELGVIAALALYGAIAGLVWRCWRGLRTRTHDRHFAAGGIAISVLVGLHSLVDFSLQIPAVTVTYMYLMGIAVAQSYSRKTS